MNYRLGWLPGSDGLILTSNADREFTGIARYDLATRGWQWLVTDDAADLVGWLRRTDRACWSSATTTARPSCRCTARPPVRASVTWRCRPLAA